MIPINIHLLGGSQVDRSLAASPFITDSWSQVPKELIWRAIPLGIWHQYAQIKASVQQDFVKETTRKKFLLY